MEKLSTLFPDLAICFALALLLFPCLWFALKANDRRIKAKKLADQRLKDSKKIIESIIKSTNRRELELNDALIVYFKFKYSNSYEGKIDLEGIEALYEGKEFALLAEQFAAAKNDQQTKGPSINDQMR